MNNVYQQLNSDRKLALLFGCLLLFLGSHWFHNAVAFEKTSNLKKEGEIRSFCQGDLKLNIEKILSTKNLQRSQWGILVKNLNNGEILYDLEAQKYFIPASNVKLLITAAALVKFGSKFQFSTPVYSQGNAPNLTLLKVVGKGDPTLQTEQLEQLAQDLKRQGIREINTLVVEDNNISINGINPTWEWEDIQFYYATAVNRLILNENAVILKLVPQKLGEPVQLEWSDQLAAQQWQINNQTITAQKKASYSIKIKPNFGQPLLTITGELAIDSQPDTFGLSIVEPAKYFLASLKNVLEKEGIKIGNTQIITNSQENQSRQQLTSIQSPTLEAIIKKTNQESNNLYAESLLNLFVTDDLNKSKLENLAEILTEIGLNTDGYQLKDGSGLSRHNLITPDTLVTLLQLMTRMPEEKTYRNSLAVAGVSGTLKNRFQDTILEGNIQAKTGTLSGNSTLSGYINPPNFSPLVFSIMVNQSNLPASELRDIIDNVLLTIGQLKQC